MTDTPNRSVGGLTPRGTSSGPDLSRLQRRNRTADPQIVRTEDATISTFNPPTNPEPVQPTTPQPAVPAGREDGPEPQDRITIYLGRSLRARARTAYRATAHLEGDRTWSDFIERAIRAEVERREHEHNSDHAYTGTSERLAPGRTVQ